MENNEKKPEIIEKEEEKKEVKVKGSGIEWNKPALIITLIIFVLLIITLIVVFSLTKKSSGGGSGCGDGSGTCPLGLVIALLF